MNQLCTVLAASALAASCQQGEKCSVNGYPWEWDQLPGWRDYCAGIISNATTCEAALASANGSGADCGIKLASDVTCSLGDSVRFGNSSFTWTQVPEWRAYCESLLAGSSCQAAKDAAADVGTDCGIVEGSVTPPVPSPLPSTTTTTTTTTTVGASAGECKPLAGHVEQAACDKCKTGYEWWPCKDATLCTEACNVVAGGNTGGGNTGGGSVSTTTTTTTPLPVVGDDKPVLKKIIDELKKADYSFLKALQPDNTWQPSKLYKKDDMISAVMKAIETGVGPLKLYDGADMGADAYKYALTNIAAFLAQSMQETIQYDACDENNWDFESYPDSAYRAASACGQLEQSYGNYKCGAGDEHMACEVDPTMELVATTHAKWYGAPGPMFCGPKSKMPVAPMWTTGGWCDTSKPQNVATTFDDIVANLNSGKTCSDYHGQQGGSWIKCSDPEKCAVHSAPNFGINEKRYDVEGCCWWGRGVIQTTGVCNFGKLNYHLGKRAKDEGRSALYGDIDFCKRPDKICSDPNVPDLKWFAGLFYYMSDVQTYSAPDWDYFSELKKFVGSNFNNGNIGDNGFIRGVSGIVNRGCHNPPNCGTGDLHGGSSRATNFKTVLKAFGLI